MVRFHMKSGLPLMLLALGFLALSARPAQAQLRDNRLGIFVTFQGKGALVVGFIPGSPAARAGVQFNDIIERVDGHHVNNPGEYQRHVGKAGRVANLHIKRGGKTFNVKVGN